MKLYWHRLQHILSNTLYSPRPSVYYGDCLASYWQSCDKSHVLWKHYKEAGCCRADSRLAISQWETSLQNNAVSHWLGANLESALCCKMPLYSVQVLCETGNGLAVLWCQISTAQNTDVTLLQANIWPGYRIIYQQFLSPWGCSYHNILKYIFMKECKSIGSTNAFSSVVWIHFLGWQDDVIRWKHFPHYWPFVQEIHRSLVYTPH